MTEVIVKVTKISSNASWPILYIPKEVKDKLGFKIGTKVIIKTDDKGRLIIEKAE
ncbi:MAG: AbrB/MazE/SpoVT family DNA-binding domain-containing protein [Deltaproteobacteria bacterium]|nr:AbrB/MazE/SpoVT family DNA-binding domain-containing protein [Deltaproteobacteria bacterium]